ncbi:UDP-2,4-diacetamido-2,4,6-trideoxy-beta-L-altropyranose hydrolase [Campylobacter lari]|uniref:UDP-2,4-diacetamido-2,4, 6-trideoxy-beta-L-altropyranose hydrolase n=1 Tax=Campylobacter lari TaxID=201 RepID=UPI000F6D2CAC|nr:UDP-2,4-diacetamido-2,4,6-trideoxy-beta-L-altropyranose hydrolase [Campylobacter lari]EAK0848432.1 UDP-2,4-diacetamido-2,4,6-trideoxy-beta-L-altropyranose hydrolase [Campylobacter lari]MCR6543445.1 UDP-2,4-diacetamido-2,4,6-trideoxy-beta-L-altropyranose hydrolase [Campylobacter lari]VEJ07663.1 nucleotidase specific for PseC product, UDP-4-amino-4,6-dideoxy-beta-L-AltNAc [Campylobacter lari]
MKVLIRSDSSSQIGHGHIKRDLILAKQYEDVSFACLPLKGSLIDEIPYPVYELTSASIYELINLIKKEKFDLLIIDHYEITADDEKLIKLETGIKILSFDDEIKEHFCDILLNVNAYAKESDYENLVPKYCELRCGFSYALIRDEFYQESKIQREKIYDYFICIGGSDNKNLSFDIANKLDKNKAIIIATTKANLHLKSLQKLSQKNSNIQVHIDYPNLARLMNESKKLIISASSLVNEALILKANFKAIAYTKNQEKLATWLVKKGYEVESFI